MAIVARLKAGETLGDRVMKVDHAGEHGAACIYSAQAWVARWRAPDMVDELNHFRAHEQGHRARFGAVLEARGLRRCRSYHLCALGGLTLGAVTGLLGRGAIAATTVAVERVVLRHLREQVAALERVDPDIHPRLDQIADFSSIMDLPPDKRSERSVQEAQAFFATAADAGLLFELALRPARSEREKLSFVHALRHSCSERPLSTQRGH